MRDCSAALKQLESLDLAGWTGLPATCREADVTAVFAKRSGDYGTFFLGSDRQSARFELLDFAGRDEPLQMWLVDNAVRMLETEYPKLVGGVDKLTAALGTPEATLEFAWDIVTLEGELVWATRGITLFINPQNNAAIRVAVYAPTDVETYAKQLRVDRTVREHRPE